MEKDDSPFYGKIDYKKGGNVGIYDLVLEETIPNHYWKVWVALKIREKVGKFSTMEGSTRELHNNKSAVESLFLLQNLHKETETEETERKIYDFKVLLARTFWNVSRVWAKFFCR